MSQTQNLNHIAKFCCMYMFFLGKDWRLLSPFTFLYTFEVPPAPFRVYILFDWSHNSRWFHIWLRYIVIVWLVFLQEPGTDHVKILWITLQSCLFVYLKQQQILYSLVLCFSIFWKFSLYNNMEEILLATVKKVSFTD